MLEEGAKLGLTVVEGMEVPPISGSSEEVGSQES